MCKLFHFFKLFRENLEIREQLGNLEQEELLGTLVHLDLKEKPEKVEKLVKPDVMDLQGKGEIEV